MIVATGAVRVTEGHVGVEGFKFDMLIGSNFDPLYIEAIDWAIAELQARKQELLDRKPPASVSIAVDFDLRLPPDMP